MADTCKFKGTLLEHQQESIDWALNMHDEGLGHILGDSKGMGRTVSPARFIAVALTK